MKSQPHILIVGGGVSGLSTAYQLAKRRVSVTLVEKAAVGQQSSWAGAGMLPPGNLTTAKTPEARLRSLSHQIWDEVAADLTALTGIGVGYTRCGSIEFDDGTLAERTAEWREEGLQVEELDRNQLERFVPDAHPDLQSAVRLPEFGQVRNPRYAKALAAACRQLGVEIIEHAESLELTLAGGAAQATLNDRMLPADRICVAAGAWTPSLLSGFDVQLPVVPVRGQMCQLQVDQLPFTHVVERGRRYLVPRADGLVLIGSTEEHAGFDKQTTSEGVSTLLQFAASLVPELGQAPMVRNWAGLRPGSPDELPFMGAIEHCPNLFIAAGHFRSGLQMSTGTGLLMSQLLLDEGPAIPMDGLNFEIADGTIQRQTTEPGPTTTQAEAH